MISSCFITTEHYFEKMLTFESLLVKELQKQQSRAEFCDIVLHTQGVSVPVHSCVLSAFSPWLYGALSTMPPSGQKRQIEVHAKEACTLLSLVTLLYSGHFNDDKEDVLSAACKLGIIIPQQDTTPGSKSQDGKAESTTAQQTSGSQSGTQTGHTKETVERECQTEILLPSECLHPKQTVEAVNVIDLSSWRSDQGLDPYSTACDITLTTLQNVQGVPEKLPSFEVMDGVPETSMYPTVSAPACAPHQGYACPIENWSEPPPPHPYPCSGARVEPLASQGQSALGGEVYNLGGLEQFENNIPGFINYFLKSNSTQATGQRGRSQRGMRGDIRTRGTARRARRARTSGNCAFRSEGLNLKKREQHIHRFGRVASSVGIGQGGGRAGRMLDTRQVLKHQGRQNRRQDRGQTDRSSTRGRKRQAESRFVEAEGQDEPPPIRRKRGRPPKRPLPQICNRSELSSSKKKATNLPAPSLMHTAALPAANQTGLAQPLDWLIDDVIAQLPFMPPVSSGSSDSHPRTQTLTKNSDFGMVQAQSEGELTDILDSFLRTFEQHIGACDSDVRDGMPTGSQSSVTDKTTDAYQHSAQNHTVMSGITDTHTKKARDAFRDSSVNITTSNGPKASFQNRPKVSRYRSSFSSEISGVDVKKLKGRQSERSEIPRMTRSQSRKRNLEYMQEQGVETSMVDEKKKQLRHAYSEKKGSICKIDSNCNVASALRKVMKMPSACSPKPKKFFSESSESHSHEESGLVNKHAKRNKARNPIKESKLTKTTFAESHPGTDLSAFDLMRNLLENQKRTEEQKKDDNKSLTAERQIERGETLEHTCEQGDQLTKGEKRARTSNMTSQQDLSKAMPSASPAIDPAVPSEEPGHTQSPTDSSEEDVDVVEISSSLFESSVVQPLVADIVLSSEEDEEGAEIDVLDSN